MLLVYRLRSFLIDLKDSIQLLFYVIDLFELIRGLMNDYR